MALATYSLNVNGVTIATVKAPSGLADRRVREQALLDYEATPVFGRDPDLPRLIRLSIIVDETFAQQIREAAAA